MENPSSVVLVTGAMGQLGRRVTQLLLERGRTVVALDLGNETTRAVASELQASAVEPGCLVPAYVDLLDAEALIALLDEQQPGVIVHLAAIIAPTCYHNPTLGRRVNVEGTRNLVQAASSLIVAPMFIEASSASVYGSRNPYRHPDRLTAASPLNPIDCYGLDKVMAEEIVAASGLPHASLRLGGIISSDMLSADKSDFLVLMRATPRDNRVHAVDGRDAALAFANAADLGTAIDGKVLLIGGNESFVLLQRDLEDDILEALGIGRLGHSASLPGDPDDDDGWGLTDWFDTTEAQELLKFQEHNWDDTMASLAAAQKLRWLIMVLSPLLRLVMLLVLAFQRRREGRHTYADPWNLITQTYGAGVLADRSQPPPLQPPSTK